MTRAAIPSRAGRSLALIAGACALVGALAAVITLSPPTAALSVPLLLGAAVAVSHRAATARISARVAAAGMLAALAVLTAVAPAAAVVVAGGICVAGILLRFRRVVPGAVRWVARVATPPLAAALCLALALAVAIYPRSAVLAAAGMILLGAAWGARGGIGALMALVSAVVVCAIAIGLTVAPAATLLAALVTGIVVLARWSPPLALGGAVLLFEFEGSVKILLGLDGVELPGGNRAAGAAALDVALLAGVAGVLIQDRLRAPRRLWASATRAERIVIGVIGAWFGLSVLQILQGGDLIRGLQGFRLFQWYTLVALAALTVFSYPRLRPGAVRATLAIALVVCLYAAVRVVVGPADAELEFATAVQTTTTYGNTVRAVGSFSSAVGLSSFLTPVSVFALVLGLLVPRVRVFAWIVAVLALVGLVGSFSRASLFGVALGLCCALLLVFVAVRMPTRRKLAVAGIVISMLACTYSGLWAASQASPQLRERAEGVLDPFHDESVRLRFETWEGDFDDALAHPLGQGVGSVGAASAPTRRQLRTTDNSFIKVLIEQGVLGLTLFVFGILGAVVLLARRLRAAPGELRPAGLAALAGFVSFLGVALAGEAVEQPGKLAAWAFLGIAAAHAFGGSHPARGETA